MKRMFLWIILLCVAAVSVPSSPAQAKLDQITTIDVSVVAPRDVFESLSRMLGYELTIAPEIQKPVTMYLEKVTVRTALTALSENLGCQWSIVRNSLRVQPAGSGKPGPAGVTGSGIGSGQGTGVGAGRGGGIGSGIGVSDYYQMMECRTPSHFRFDNTSLDSVTDALGKVCNMDIRVDESIKTRIVTIDLSNRTILSALKIISNLDGPQKPMILSVISSPSDKEMRLIMYISPQKDR